MQKTAGIIGSIALISLAAILAAAISVGTTSPAHAQPCIWSPACTDPRDQDEYARQYREREAEQKRRELEAYRRQNPVAPAAPDNRFYQMFLQQPSGYVGRTFTFSGKIVQAVRSNDGYTLRVNVTEGTYKIWTDTVWVDYRATMFEPMLSEGAVIEFNSRFLGIKTYTAVLGQTIQLPHFLACEVRPAMRGVVTAPRPC